MQLYLCSCILLSHMLYEHLLIFVQVLIVVYTYAFSAYALWTLAYFAQVLIVAHTYAFGACALWTLAFWYNCFRSSIHMLSVHMLYGHLLFGTSALDRPYTCF